MKTRNSPGFLALLAVLLIALAATYGWQWRQSAHARADLELARTRAEELAALRAENQRLRARQVPTAELEQLRADHAALPRLRSELEAARRGIETRR